MRRRLPLKGGEAAAATIGAGGIGAASAGGEAAAGELATAFAAGLAGLLGFGGATSCSGALGVALASASGRSRVGLGDDPRLRFGRQFGRQVEFRRRSFGRRDDRIEGAHRGLHWRSWDDGERRNLWRCGVGVGDQRPIRVHRNRLHWLGGREHRRDRSRGGGGWNDRRVGRGCDGRDGDRRLAAALCGGARRTGRGGWRRRRRRRRLCLGAQIDRLFFRVDDLDRRRGRRILHQQRRDVAARSERSRRSAAGPWSARRRRR